jgi:hypothetical protein
MGAKHGMGVVVLPGQDAFDLCMTDRVGELGYRRTGPGRRLP